MLICPKCYRAWWHPNIRCRTTTPNGNCKTILIAIDDLLAEIMVLYWKANITTYFSCSGHPFLTMIPTTGKREYSHYNPSNGKLYQLDVPTGCHAYLVVDSVLEMSARQTIRLNEKYQPIAIESGGCGGAPNSVTFRHYLVYPEDTVLPTQREAVGRQLLFVEFLYDVLSQYKQTINLEGR